MQASLSAHPLPACGLPVAVKAQAPLNAASTCWRAHRRVAHAQVHTCAANTSSFSSMASQDDDGEPFSQRVYMIDPENSPGMVQEFQVEPHPDIDRAHEVLNSMEAQDFGGSGPRNWGEEAQAGPAADNSAALATQQAEFSQSLSNREAKASEMQKALVSQLEMEQRQVIELQRYEGLYKEVMMRADRSEADVAYMQNMVAEKDAELAHTYKLLENSARERSRLRQEHQAAQERMRDLQVQLIQAQAQARAPKMGALGAASPAAPPSKKEEGAGTGAGAGASPSSPSSMNGAIEELTNLAYSLAMDMSEEVKGFYPKAEGSSSSSSTAAEGPLSDSSRATSPAPEQQPPPTAQQSSSAPASSPPPLETPSHVPPSPSSRFHRANASMR